MIKLQINIDIRSDEIDIDNHKYHICHEDDKDKILSKDKRYLFLSVVLEYKYHFL